MMGSLFESMRPYQWVKNLLVFAPLVFAQVLFEAGPAKNATVAFLAFCSVASAIYLLNDLLDLERDKLHPEKKTRPLPSGRLGVTTARVAFVALVLVGAALALIAEHAFYIPLAGYFVINVAYSFKLKHIVILDTMCVAVGFLLRVYVGGLAIAEPVSGWLTLCTFFVALLLAFCKRRHELALLGEGSMAHRQTLEEYSLPFLDQLIAPLGALTVMTYSLYTVSPETRQEFGEGNKLILTVPFVVYGIFRYLYLVHIRAEGGNPTRLLLKDNPIRINIVLWFVVAVAAIYGTRLQG